MAEFCSCGSLMIGGSCTNKNCSNKAAGKPAASKRAGAKKAAGRTGASLSQEKKTESAYAKARRASKCITYNLYDTKPNENNEEEE